MTNKEFAATDLGRLMIDFENKLARAWQLDTEASHNERVLDKRLKEIWDAANTARAALIEKLITIALPQ